MNALMDMLKRVFRQLTPLELIVRELAQAHLAKLEAETAVDYAQSVVSYHKVRIERLNAHMAVYSGKEAA